MTESDAPAPSPRRHRLHQIIFLADTAAGRTFDLLLIVFILLSVVVVSVETVAGLTPEDYAWLRAVEWALTGVFTVEYVLRLISVRRPLAYATSFFGVVDLLAILPTYVSVLVPGAQALLVVRVLRLVRVFRVLKLTRYLVEAQTLGSALRASGRKITVFLLVVSTLIVIIGSLMYVIEGRERGFTSIPISMYWTVVTLTTVGYGDISPQTPLGRALASLVMILGYGIIAVPTGIVTAELTQGAVRGAFGGAHPAGAHPAGDRCGACGKEGHAVDAAFCRGCGTPLSAVRPTGA